MNKKSIWLLFPLHFNSVEQILTQLEQQPGWEKFREYRQLLKCWSNTVNSNTAKYTRPLYVSRQVLWVATSSAARAQELSFQRYTLLKRLNKQLTFTLKDIRFSDSKWHQEVSPHDDRPEIFSLSDRHKFQATPAKANIVDRLAINRDKLSTASASERAKDAARSWLTTLQHNSPSLTCSNCGAATSNQEIERWNSCYHCAAREWSEEYRPPTFPELK